MALLSCFVQVFKTNVLPLPIFTNKFAVILCCRSCFGNINFFGGPSTTCVKVSTKLQEIEAANEDAMFVFISDVWLDDVKVRSD